jgi:plastocyanin
MSIRKGLLRLAVPVMSLVLVAGPAAALGSDALADHPVTECLAPATAAPGVEAAASPGITQVDVTTSPATSPEPCATDDAASRPDDDVATLTVEAGDLWFGPDELTISSLGQTTIVLTDVGYAVHNLTVDELDLLVVTPPGHTAEVTITDPEPGTYEFYCSVSGHREAGMVGTLVVK